MLAQLRDDERHIIRQRDGESRRAMLDRLMDRVSDIAPVIGMESFDDEVFLAAWEKEERSFEESADHADAGGPSSSHLLLFISTIRTRTKPIRLTFNVMGDPMSADIYVFLMVAVGDSYCPSTEDEALKRFFANAREAMAYRDALVEMAGGRLAPPERRSYLSKLETA